VKTRLISYERYVERNSACEEKLILHECSYEWKKVDKRRLKNCVNVVTYETRLISYERTYGPIKEMYGETFWRPLLSLELMAEKRCHLRQEEVGRNVERTKQVSYEHHL